MNKQFKEVGERAMSLRDKLSWDNPEEKKNIRKVDGIIKGAGILKYMHISMSAGAVLTGLYILYLLFNVLGIKTIPIALGVSAIIYGIAFVSLKIQMKLYNRTMNKIKVNQ